MDMSGNIGSYQNITWPTIVRDTSAPTYNITMDDNDFSTFRLFLEDQMSPVVCNDEPLYIGDNCFALSVTSVSGTGAVPTVAQGSLKHLNSIAPEGGPYLYIYEFKLVNVKSYDGKFAIGIESDSDIEDKAGNALRYLDFTFGSDPVQISASSSGGSDSSAALASGVGAGGSGQAGRGRRIEPGASG